MAQGYSAETVGVLDGTVIPAKKADGRVYQSRMRRIRATLDLSQATVARASGDTNVLGKIPGGCAFAFGIINASATMGSSTIAVGIAGTAGKYMAAATFTGAAPALFGLASAVDDAPLEADETVIMTVGAATLPSSGILTIDLYFSGR
ncbi:hypothetical protein FHS96_004983 [Sphingomonas zeicaulis]|uniref:hypothetical protein n=1 Tax=Sphingomonas zeicaulis TaxID=1632740 RepID=UPI003D192CEE